jgi:hypothetical protein
MFGDSEYLLKLQIPNKTLHQNDKVLLLFETIVLPLICKRF